MDTPPPDPRVEALRHLRILDTPPEAPYEDVVRLVARRFDVPIALVNFIDADRQWIKAQVGIDLGPLPLDQSGCAVTVRENTPVVAPDTTLDPRFRHLDAVTGPAGIRFYAGVPVVTASGHAVGTVCVLDRRPRTFTDEDLRDLRAYADLVSHSLAARPEAMTRLDALDALEAHDLAIVAVDADRRILFLNGAARHLYRVQADPRGEPFTALAHAAFLNATDRARCEAAMRDGQPWTGDALHTRHDGQVMQVELRVSPTFDREGQPRGHVLLVRDVTQQRRAETLKEQLLGHAEETLSLHAPDGTVLYVNRTDAHRTGLTPEALVGRNGFEIIHPDDHHRVRHAFTHPHPDGAPHRVTWRQRTLDGSWRSMESMLAPITDAGGHLQHILMVSRDVTERLVNEERLRLLESAVLASRQGLIITTAASVDGPGPRVVFVNEAFTRLSGYAPEDIVGRSPTILHGPDTDPDTVRRIVDGGRRWVSMDETILHYAKGGQPYWVQMSMTPVKDTAGWHSHWVSVMRDVTRDRQQDLLNRDRREVLERVTRDRPLPEVLGALLDKVRHQMPDVLPSVLLLQDGRLSPATDDGLPRGLRDAVTGLEPGPHGTPCGQAVHHARTVIAADLLNDPQWAHMQQLARSLDVRSCWSTPILSGENTVLGTFALYARQPRAPSPWELAVLEDTARLTAVIVARYRAQEDTRRLALYDPLTDLPNRRSFTDLVRQAIHAHRPGTLVAVGLLDVDRFKNVNDSFGHALGDDLLRQVAARLQGALGRDGQVARMGGDEFTFLAVLACAADLQPYAQRVLGAFDASFDLAGQEVFMRSSVGIALYPDDAHTPDELLRLADIAMYHAKRRDLGWAAMRSGGRASARRRVQLEVALHHALERDELRAHYQPIVDARTGQAVEVEALMRWHSRDHGPVSPAEFIPVAEDTAQIVTLGQWMLRQACHDVARLQRTHPGLRVAVNVSPKQFQHPDLVGMVRAALRDHDLPPGQLTLEITEGVMMDQVESVRRICELRALGVRVAIDDFGTGFSSLHYLKNLPLNSLKIDRTFVEQLRQHPQGVDAHIMQSVAHLCRGLDLELTAEGVETREQAELLRGMGMTLLQGWHFARDLPIDALSAWLDAHAPHAAP